MISLESFSLTFECAQERVFHIHILFANVTDRLVRKGVTVIPLMVQPTNLPSTLVAIRQPIGTPRFSKITPCSNLPRRPSMTARIKVDCCPVSHSKYY